MANSIQGVGGLITSQVDVGETSRAAKQSVQSGAPSSNNAATLTLGDATNISNLGNVIAGAVKRAAGQSSIRFGLVASLKAQIASGTYSPDPNEVAARVAAGIKP